MTDNHHVRLNLVGVTMLPQRTQNELVVGLRHEFGALAKEAGKILIITLGSHHISDLTLTFSNDKRVIHACQGSGFVLGDDGTGAIDVYAHKQLRVCGPLNPISGAPSDRRKILTTDKLLGGALFNTAMHELGHFVADLEHSKDGRNYMITGDLPRNERTMTAQRRFFAGKLTFDAAQKQKLRAHINAKEWVDPLKTQ